MKDNIKDIARKIARLSSANLRELETALMENGISATIYRFSPIESMWDTNTEGYGKQGLYSVTLEWIPNNKKLVTVKTLKEMLGIGLKEAKNFVDNTPSLILDFATEGQADALREALEDDIGCDVEIKRYEN